MNEISKQDNLEEKDIKTFMFKFSVPLFQGIHFD
jgi:hypothetical protein